MLYYFYENLILQSLFLSCQLKVQAFPQKGFTETNVKDSLCYRSFGRNRRMSLLNTSPVFVITKYSPAAQMYSIDLCHGVD